MQKSVTVIYSKNSQKRSKKCLIDDPTKVTPKEVGLTDDCVITAVVTPLPPLEE